MLTSKQDNAIPRNNLSQHPECQKNACNFDCGNVLSTYTGVDGMRYRGDSNLEDVCHLAETIRRVCNLAIDDLSSIQSLSKQQVIEIVELVEYELLSQRSIEPVKCSVVSDPLAIRVKQENQSTCN